MTKVYIEIDGDRYKISAHDHATGSEQCCAAVSGLVYALAGYLKNAAAKPKEHYVKLYDMRLESADALLVASGDKTIEAAFDMAAIGLLQLAKQYPNYVSAEMRKIS